MSYRANVTDKQQSDVEGAANDSAIRVQSFDSSGDGTTKFVKAYDGIGTAAQAPNETGATSITALNNAFGTILGQHNDKPATFATPGKA